MSKPRHHQDRSQRHRRAQKRGRWAETLTALYLRLTGHRVLARNYKTQQGEIDLIVRRHTTISFVEVKARATRTLALEAIHPHQCRRIERAAEIFLARHPALIHCGVRFDVALVTGPFQVSVLQNAWRP